MSNNREGYKSELSINNLESLLENENYKKFYEDKQKLKEKYHEWLFENPSRVRKERKEWYLHKGGQEQWRKYLKEIGDLMLHPNSDFQEFTWDILSDKDKEVRERMSTSKPENLHHY